MHPLISGTSPSRTGTSNSLYDSRSHAALAMACDGLSCPKVAETAPFFSEPGIPLTIQRPACQMAPVSAAIAGAIPPELIVAEQPRFFSRPRRMPKSKRKPDVPGDVVFCGVDSGRESRGASCAPTSSSNQGTVQ